MEDTLSYIGSAHEVDLEKFSLEVTFVRSVALKSLEENCSGFLDSLMLKEDLNDSIERCLGLATCITHGDHLCKVYCCCGVLWDNSSEDLHEVRLVSSLLAVGEDLVELVGFNKSLDDSIRVSTLLENLQGESRVVLSHEISELVGHGEFLLSKPGLDHLNLALVQDSSAEFKRFELIKSGDL